jgi:hypothetical protein
MTNVQTVYNNPDIEAYRLGLLGDAQGIIRNNILGRQVQGLRNSINPETGAAYTDAEIALALSTPGMGVEGEDGYVAPVNYDPAYISSISQDASFDPAPFQVAGLTRNERDAIRMARNGIGSYQSYIDSADRLLGRGRTAISSGLRDARSGTKQALQGMRTAGREGYNYADAARTGGDSVLNQLGLDQAQAQALMDAAILQGQQGFESATGAARSGTGRAVDALYGAGSAAQSIADQTSYNARYGTGAAMNALYGAGSAAQNIADQTSYNARSLFNPLDRASSQATQGGRGAAGQGQAGADRAAFLARRSTAEAQNRLGEASDFGMGAARSGIGQLLGASGQFNPDSISSFNNPYEADVVQASLADLERVANRRKLAEEQRIGAESANVGAFGTSGYERALDRSIDPIQEELDRNTASTIAQLRSQGYETSAQRAMSAFENARNRQIQAAQATGQLGQVGAQTASSAAQAGGQLGLSAETLAQGSALQGAALGLDAEKFAAANAAALAQTGLNIEQLAAQTGLNAQQIAGNFARDAGQLNISTEQLAAQTGLNAQQMAGNFARDAGQLNLSTEQLASQNADAAARLGMSGAEFQAANAMSYAQTGMNVEQLAAQTGMNAATLAGQLAQQRGQLSQGMGSLGLNAAGAYGTLGIQTAGLGELEQSLYNKDISTLLSTGGIQRTNDQAVLDALKMTNDQYYKLPYQELGFLSDVYAGVPTSASTVSSNVGSSASPFMQAATLGIGGLSAYAGAQRAGIF